MNSAPPSHQRRQRASTRPNWRRLGAIIEFPILVDYCYNVYFMTNVKLRMKFRHEGSASCGDSTKNRQGATFHTATPR